MKLSQTSLLCLLASVAFAVPFKTRDDKCNGCDPIVHATTETSIYSCQLAGVLGDPRTTLEAFENGLIQPPERIYPELFRQLLQQCCDAVDPKYTNAGLPSDVDIEYKTPTTVGDAVDGDLEYLDMAGVGIKDLRKAVVSTVDAHLPSDLSVEYVTPDAVIDAVDSVEHTIDLPSSTPLESGLAMLTADVNSAPDSAIDLVTPIETQVSTPGTPIAILTSDASSIAHTITLAGSSPSTGAEDAPSSNDNSSPPEISPSPSSTDNVTPPQSSAPSPTPAASSAQDASTPANSPAATDASPAPSDTAADASFTSAESGSATASPSAAAASSAEPTPAPASNADNNGSDDDEDDGSFGFIVIPELTPTPMSSSTSPDCQFSNPDDSDIYAELCESASVSFGASTTSTLSTTPTPTSASEGCRLSHKDEGDVWVEVCESLTATVSASALSSSATPAILAASPQ